MSEAIDFRLIRRPTPGRGNARASGYERHTNDWYCEPARAVDALLDAEPFAGSVLDPACGGGNVVGRCLARGLEAYGSDLVDRANGIFPVIDFFDVADPVANIITNPPYGVAEQFIQHALAIADRKVAVLVRLAFLEGRRRYARLFKPTPPARIWQFSSRISMPPGDSGAEAKGGAVAFCWIVWDRQHSGAPAFGWLP